jgi:hypothetical protein
VPRVETQLPDTAECRPDAASRCHMVNPLEIMPVLALALMLVLLPLVGEPP